MLKLKQFTWEDHHNDWAYTGFSGEDLKIFVIKIHGTESSGYNTWIYHGYVKNPADYRIGTYDTIEEAKEQSRIQLEKLIDDYFAEQSASL